MKNLPVQVDSFANSISINGCEMSAYIFDGDGVVKGFVVDVQTGQHIADCINVCQGYTAESLDECLKVGGLLSIDRALVNRNAENRLLTTQTNALLVALKSARDVIESITLADDAEKEDIMLEIDSAIAIAKGGAS